MVMIEIRLDGTNASRAIEIVQELRAMGLQQNIDFDFKYHPGRYDDHGGWHTVYSTFQFHTEELATMFQLKYT
jgi:hypothetical protein